MSSFNSITTVNGKRCTLVKRTATASSPAASVAQTVSPQATSVSPNVQASVASSAGRLPVQGSSSPPSSIAGAVGASSNSPSVTGSRIPTSVRSSSRTPTNSSGASVVPAALADLTANSSTAGATGVAVLPNSSSGAVPTQTASSTGSTSDGSSHSSSQSGDSGSQQDQHHGGGSKAGMIAGVISGLILVVLLIALAWWFMKRGKRRRDRDSIGSALIGSEKSHFEHGRTSRAETLSSIVVSKFNQLKIVILAAGVALSARFSRDREEEGWPDSPERAEKRATSPTRVNIQRRDQQPPTNRSPPTNLPRSPPLASKPSFRARASRVIAAVPKPPFTATHQSNDSFDRRDWFGQVPPPDAQPTLPLASRLGARSRNQDHSDPFQDSPLQCRLSNPFADPHKPHQEWALPLPDAAPSFAAHHSNNEPPSPPPSRPVSPLTPHEARLATTHPIHEPQALYSPLPNPFTDAASSHHTNSRPHTPSGASALSIASSDLLDHWHRDTNALGPLSPMSMGLPISRQTTNNADPRDTVLTYDSICTARSDPFDLEPGTTRSMNLDSVISARPSLQKVDTVKSIGVRRVGGGERKDSEGRRSSEILTGGNGGGVGGWRRPS